MSMITLAVHKFTSCSGCQSQLLNLDQLLLALTEKVAIVHFVEAGINQADARADIALVEGSISTAEELERLQQVRINSGILVTMGACATSGGIQSLRNLMEGETLLNEYYPHALPVMPLPDSTPISKHVRVDFELWGCPISQQQLTHFLGSLFTGQFPSMEQEKLCLECKRTQQVCVMVTQQQPCIGPVTRSGCGALCPQYGRGCYGCFGPSEKTNSQGLANRFNGFGLVPDEVARRFAVIHSQAKPFRKVLSINTRGETES